MDLFITPSQQELKQVTAGSELDWSQAHLDVAPLPRSGLKLNPWKSDEEFNSGCRRFRPMRAKQRHNAMSSFLMTAKLCGQDLASFLKHLGVFRVRRERRRRRLEFGRMISYLSEKGTPRVRDAV
jgi:hypothetical protein